MKYHTVPTIINLINKKIVHGISYHFSLFDRTARFADNASLVAPSSYLLDGINGERTTHKYITECIV